MKLEILSPKLENRQEACFYYDEDVARMQLPNGKKLYLQSRGYLEILVNDTKHKGVKAFEWLIETKQNDKTFNTLYNNDSVLMSNWFAILEVDIEGNTYDDDICVEGCYDDGIESLKAAFSEAMKRDYT